MAGAKLAILGDVLDISIVVVKQAPNHFPAVPDDEDDRPGARMPNRLDDPSDHGLAGDLAGDLGQIALHAGAFAGGEDERGNRPLGALDV